MLLIAFWLLLLFRTGEADVKQDAVISRTSGIDFIYPVDYADDRVLVGASHDVFVGKVIAQSGQRDRGLGPETQFVVRVISNIKGELQGTVTVNQEGGFKNGVLYSVGGSDIFGPNNIGATDYLLRPGKTYLLATRYNPAYGWYTLNPFPTARKLISQDASLSAAVLAAVGDNDQRVKQLEAAYSHEITFQADVSHGNAKNSYRSLHVMTATSTSPNDVSVSPPLLPKVSHPSSSEKYSTSTPTSSIL
ncbi:hypothetical protein AYO50_01440 [Acidobacteria bacterium SCGC AG-212-P17]|nr:hypothetical protein AYO50_01440 [Acidobacteria bacterium SCGC AG-212-P17]